MKLAILLQEIHPHAGQTYDIVEFIKTLSSSYQTWEFYIITYKIFYPLNPIFQAQNVKIIQTSNLYLNLVFPNKLSKVLSKYDIIFVKGSYPFAVSAARSGKPNILIVHQLDSPRIFTSLPRRIRSYFMVALTGYILKKPKAIVTITEELALFYSSRYNIRINVLHDIVSEAFFQANLRQIPSDLTNIKLLSVGNWDGFNNRKRHEIIIKNFSNLVLKYPNIKLTLAGLSPRNIDVLGKVVSDYNLENNVILKGFLQEKDLVREYLLNDIYVTATTYEGFYRQIIEGFATGMPALVYDARLVVDDISQCATVNHVIKSAGGKLYRNSDEFVNGLEVICENYLEYSLRTAKYAEKYRGNSLLSEIDDLISDVTSNGNDKQHED
jgi:glycosyltransferase involved in cell wall biosynthesis